MTHQVTEGCPSDPSWLEQVYVQAALSRGRGLGSVCVEVMWMFSSFKQKATDFANNFLRGCLEQQRLFCFH